MVVDLDRLFEAWARVSENGGCAGCDGLSLDRFAHNLPQRLEALLDRVILGRYRPYPLLKIVVEKKPGSEKRRTLLVPAVGDRVLQTAVARVLSRSFEEEFLECSFAYRPGRSVDRAIARIRKCRELGYTYVVDADIEQYYDNVDHDLLLRRLQERTQDPVLFDLLRMWVRGSVWDGEKVHALRRGIPQGSPISPLFANLFLEDFDRELEKSGQKLVRYSDDFIVLSRTAEEAQQALVKTEELLTQAHLDLNREKTRITSFHDGFRFLGALFTSEEIWVPWMHNHHKGRMYFMARPMPAGLRRQYEDAPGRSQMEQAFLHVQLPHPHPSSNLFKAGYSEGAQSEKDMAYLYLLEQGSVLRKSGDRFLVEKDDEIRLDVPYHKLETVILFGNVQVTSQAMAELLDKGVSLSMFSRQGTFRGSLSPPRGSHIGRRIAQFDHFRDAAGSLATARAIIGAKIANGLWVLNHYRKHNPVEESFSTVLNEISTAERQAGEAENLAVLDGTEGAAARAYFTALMQFNRSHFSWTGRRRHPAPDPLNALLSLTYTLLGNELTGLLEASGLDPYLGFLHQPDYGRPSLALDLLEPFRHPIADRFVLTIVNRAQFDEGDFESPESRGGVYLKPKALKRYLAEYEHWMLAGLSTDSDASARSGASCRDLLKREVEKLSAALDHRQPFVALRMEEAEPRRVSEEVRSELVETGPGRSDAPLPARAEGGEAVLGKVSETEAAIQGGTMPGTPAGARVRESEAATVETGDTPSVPVAGANLKTG